MAKGSYLWRTPAEYLESERRFIYTTPKTFLELIKLYKNVLLRKRKQTQVGTRRAACWAPLHSCMALQCFGHAAPNAIQCCDYYSAMLCPSVGHPRTAAWLCSAAWLDERGGGAVGG